MSTYPHTFRSEHTETVTTSSIYGSFYRKQMAPHIKIPEKMVPLLHHVDDASDEFVENLKDFVAVPNISGKFEHRHDMNTAIKLVEVWMKKLKIKYERYEIGWHEMSEACCKMPNVILGHTLGANKKMRTVILILIYI